MTTHRLLLHSDGPALWPQHKPLGEVLELRAVTPALIWSGTYQGVPSPPGGYIFKRSWWRRKNRYETVGDCHARFISWDTGMKDEEKHDPSACLVADLLPDYRLYLRWAYAEQLEFPDLATQIQVVAETWNHDGKLSGVIIEDKASGTSALQTLRAVAPAWLVPLLMGFMPTTDKVTRAGQASVWCQNDCVLFPRPGAAMHWLIDFEDELFNFPQATHDDRVDAFSQLLLYLENLLEHGYHARGGEHT